MLARLLKSGSFHDVVGYVTREFHDKKEYTEDTWRILDSYGIYTQDYKKMVQSFDAAHGFMPEKEKPAGHISISFDKADAPKLTDDFMVKLAKEYMEGMKITDTQYMIVRHLETEHLHFHIVYNRVNMQGRAIDERNNFKRSDKVVKAIKDKYGLTYSLLKQKYAERIPEIEKKIRVAIAGCRSWGEFSRKLDCAGIEVRFHDDINTGEHIGVKFSDGEITVNGFKINRAFTYRRLTNLFELNSKYSQGHQTAMPMPTMRTERAQKESTGIIGAVVDAIGSSTSDLFRPGPVPNQEPPLTDDELERRRHKKKRKGRKI
ncbi:MAG: relaxase/mobilization nuclease domain-containing protein [Muribaculum sp.]|nr:relaxase/mobilization nuclease domain-containing protein [Muribaculum sp.]